MTTTLKKITTAILFAVVFFFACQLLNSWAASAYVGKTGVLWPGHVFLRLEHNQNFVFSLPLPQPAIYAVLALVLGGLTWWYAVSYKNHSMLFSVAYAFIIGGAVANFFSRVQQGYVADYINFQIFNLRGTWNAADFLIIIGMVLWGIEMGRGKISK